MGCEISDIEITSAQYNKCAISIKNHSDKLICVFPYENNKLISCSSSNYNLLNLDKRCVESTFEFKEKATSLFFIQQGFKLLCGYESGLIDIIEVHSAKKKKSKQLIAHEVPVTSMLLLSNGFFVSGDSEGQVILWDLKLKDEVNSFKAHGGAVTQFNELNDKRLLSIGGDNCINIYAEEEGISYALELYWLTLNTTCLIQLKNDELIYNSKQALIGTRMDLIEGHLKSKEKNKLPKPMRENHKAHEASITFLLNLDSEYEFASASNDTTIKIWDTSTLNCLTILEGHTDSVNFLIEKAIKYTKKTNKSLNENEKATEEGSKDIQLKERTFLVSCGDDNSVKLWTKND